MNHIVKFAFLITCLFAFNSPGDFQFMKNFGPMQINIKSLRYCKDQKGKKPSTYVFGTKKNPLTGLTDVMTVNYTLFHDAGPVQMQYKLSDWNPEKKRYGHPVTLNGGNICFCTICKETYKQYADFKEPFHACVVKKGKKFVMSNITQITQLWFGSNGIYRTVKNRAKLFTPKETLMCGYAVMEVLPA